MPRPTIPQARLLSVAHDGAMFRNAPMGGDWLYIFPGKPLMKRASGVTCRSLVKHGWLEGTRVESDPHTTNYVISAEGRRALQVSGSLGQASGQTTGPANIKF